MEHPTYLSAADAARVLGVTPATVRLMHHRGDLPLAAKTEGGVHLFSRVAVERLAVSRSARVAKQRQP
jgi:DNA-binding transcriptional MerR regulator